MKGEEDREAVAIAERIRDACVAALIDAYEDAGLRGLCGEGRWEVAVGEVRSIDPRRLLESALPRDVSDNR